MESKLLICFGLFALVLAGEPLQLLAQENKEASSESKSKVQESESQSENASENTTEKDTKKVKAKQVSSVESKQHRELRKRCQYLKPRIESILKYYFKQKEDSQRRSPWGIMHAMIAFGPYAEMYAEGKLVKDVDWLCQNGRCRSWELLRQVDGQLYTNMGPGRQGHEGQFLAILAQSQIPKSRKLTVGGKEFTIEDLIKYEMDTCKPGTELTFKLIGLSHYLDSDVTWKANDGSKWDLQRLVKEELKQPINGAACGGTHRLMGYSYSLLMRKLQDKPIEGQWARVDEFVTDFRRYAMKLQNYDGSFSTEWFRQRQARRDSQRRVQTTGHILEWLIFSADESQLDDQRIIKAVDYLSNLMWRERSTKWAVGPKGHAIRALRLFYERVLIEPVDRVASKKQIDQAISDILLR